MSLRLWQRIYLTVFILVSVILAIFSILWQRNSFRIMLESEQNTAISEHSYIINTIQNAVLTEQLRQGKLTVTTGDIRTLVSLTLQEQITQDCALFLGSVIYAYNHEETLEQKKQFSEIDNSNYALHTVLDGDRYLCYVTSRFSVQDSSFVLVSVRDLSSLYTLSQTSNWQLLFLYTAGASIMAIVLFVSLRSLLKPLQKLNTGITAIAEGNYSMRLPQTRKDELGVITDNINRMAAAIETNVRELKQVADDRQKFIDNLSHEMKTPLTSILGYADLLTIVEDIDPVTRTEYAKVILSESKRLRTLSDKLMELITVGQITSQEMRMLPIEPLIDEVALSVRPMLTQQNQHLIINVQPFSLYADKTLLQSMLYNLIDNARKASPSEGNILLQAMIRDGRPILTVTDYGIGIPPEDLEQITKPFYMVDKSRSRQAGGSGLGLALCQEIAALHHAKLKIQSELGKGTEVSVIFPSENETTERSISNETG